MFPLKNITDCLSLKRIIMSNINHSQYSVACELLFVIIVRTVIKKGLLITVFEKAEPNANLFLTRAYILTESLRTGSPILTTILHDRRRVCDRMDWQNASETNKCLFLLILNCLLSGYILHHYQNIFL